MLPQTETLLLDEDGGVLTVWLNRPETRNAITEQMVEDLIAVFEAVAGERTIRAVLLRGKGGTFCAGGDLKVFKTILGGEKDHDAVVRFSSRMGPLFSAMRRVPQVIVALVEGAAMAGGLGVSCLADVVVTTADASFAVSEVTIGLPPAQIAPVLIQRIGVSEARRLMLTAQRFDGIEAARLGFAHFVVADTAALEAKAAELVALIRKTAPDAVASTKSLIVSAQRLDHDEFVNVAAHVFADVLFGVEAREGLTAFVEKRKPNWAVEEQRNNHETI